MLQSLWNEYGNEALIALGGAFATALIMRLKAWQLGDLDNDAPFVRQFLAYAAGYAAALAAVRLLAGPARYAAIVVAASLALAVTINGRSPLISRSYVLSFAVALASGLALWALYAAHAALFRHRPSRPAPRLSHRACRTRCAVRIGVADLGAEEDDLRRVVDPDQQHHERGSSAVGRFQSLAADVPGDGELAGFEQ